MCFLKLSCSLNFITSFIISGSPFLLLCFFLGGALPLSNAIDYFLWNEGYSWRSRTQLLESTCDVSKTMTEPCIILPITKPNDAKMSFTKRDSYIHYHFTHKFCGFPTHSNALTWQEIHITFNMKPEIHEAHEADEGRSPKSGWWEKHRRVRGH